MPASNPLEGSFAEDMTLLGLLSEAGAAVWDTPLREFKRSPLATRLRLALSTETAEVQERGVATPGAAADDPASLPLAGRASDDLDSHGARDATPVRCTGQPPGTTEASTPCSERDSSKTRCSGPVEPVEPPNAVPGAVFAPLDPIDNESEVHS